MKKLFLLCFVALLSCTSLTAADRIYIDETEMNSFHNAFHIHQGNNVWIQTSTVHRDETGLYTMESNISRIIRNTKAEYQKTWKCPYCYHHWPIGTSCQNASCPSKYK